MDRNDERKTETAAPEDHGSGPEQLLQTDVGLQFDGDRIRAKVSGFYGFAWDYITFENMNVVYGPPSGQVVQEQLKLVFYS